MQRIVTRLAFIPAAVLLMGARVSIKRAAPPAENQEQSKPSAPPAAVAPRVTIERRAEPQREPEPQHRYETERRAARVGIVPRSPVDPSPNHRPIVRNDDLRRDIERHQRRHVSPHRYYWHRAGGVRYLHYFDRHHHWYGFHYGPSFYWTRYHGGNWWWWDLHFGRWNYWANGYWWWPAPHGVTYVHVDNTYYPADEAPVPVAPPTTIPAPPEGTTPPSDGTFTSADGTRMVQIHGPKAEAFLYDNKPNPPVFLTHLGENVSTVRFYGGTTGKPLQVQLDFKDGSFAFFDAAGKRLEVAPTPTLPDVLPIP